MGLRVIDNGGIRGIYPVSDLCHVVIMLSSLIGAALIARPAGLLTGAYMEEMRRKIEDRQQIVSQV